MRLALILCALSLCGCGRDRAVANSAATIWEAADAIERGVPPSAVTPSIKSNSAAIIKSTGIPYAPAGVRP